MSADTEASTANVTRVTSVQPYWDLTFDADGDPDPQQRDALLAGARGLTDLVVFSHGWNNDLSTANALYDRFYAPFPALVALAPKARFGFAGVHWPSMRFSDEPIPDFPHATVAAAFDAEAGEGPGLDAPTQVALAAVFPGGEDLVAAIARLLAEQPREPERLAEFAELVRQLTGVAPRAVAAAVPAQDLAGTADGTDPVTASADTGDGTDTVTARSLQDGGCDDDMASPAGAGPQLLAGDAVAMCDLLADARAQAGCQVAPAQGEAILGGLGKRVWDGAKELLRQATYYAMKGRAGTVGERGLGPLLGRLAAAAPGVRVHLVGHSFGARLVSFALRGLPPGVRVGSVTLLQGAFSHYAFSGPLPFDARGGALHGMQQRVTGPLVACHSSHDQALGVFYPLASRVAGEDESLLGFGDRWGAIGHDGFQAMPGVASLTLAAALAGPFPGGGCVSVDASAVVCSGGPPSGAHSDICHEELARLVLRASGRVTA